MPAVQRNGDANSAGGVVSSSRNVNVNGKPITINGDTVSPHPVGHISQTTANGSSTVRVGGIGVNRAGDTDTCGHPRVGGSSNVNAG
tara:strand:+ start:4997 stop:5257 length:261 start_codon:yes stop_codon:yes gene_type:complete